MTWFGGATPSPRRSSARHRGIVVALLAVAFTAAGATNAAATMRIEQHTDPSGDPTLFHYIETDPRGPNPNQFDLRDGEHKDFGPFAGVGTAQAVVPAGWRVVDIQCVSSHPGAPATFTIDVPNARVTVNHALIGEDSCAFTISRISTTPTAPSPGVAPTPPLNFPNAVVPRRPAVVGVVAGRGVVTASVRITGRAVIKGQLRRGNRVVGTARLVRNAGTYAVVVRLTKKARAQLRRQGLTRVTLTLRVVVVPRTGAVFVFRQRAVVRL
jgi:hypothetical protein